MSTSHHDLVVEASSALGIDSLNELVACSSANGRVFAAVASTCRECSITGTLFLAIQSGELDLSDPLAWPEAHRATLARILNEQDPYE